MSYFLEDLPHVLKHEGGFVNHPKDPGGATNKGVTLATFRRYVPGATVADLRNISADMVARVYRDGYWNAVRADDLPRGVDYVTFDAAVNSGPSRGAKWTQRAVGATQDGKVGPRTIAAARAADPRETIRRATDYRLGFVQSLRTWSTFGRGWARRIGEVRARGLALVRVGHFPDEPRVVTASDIVAHGDIHYDADRVEQKARDENATAVGSGAGGGVVAMPADPSTFDWTLVAQIGLAAALIAFAVFLASRARARKAMAEGMRAFADRIAPEA